MQICHVITNPELGGAQLSTLQLVSNLPKEKYSSSIITSFRGTIKSDFENLKDVNTYFLKNLIRSINPLFDILAFIAIYKLYMSNKYNIVHTHSSKAGIIGRWAALAAKIPVIVHTVHGWPFNEYQLPVIKRFFIFLEKITAGFTTKIICVSKSDFDTALRYNIAPKEKLVFIKYGIEFEKFKRNILDQKCINEKKRELGIRNNGPVVGMISCLKPQKSPLDYIKACIKVYDKAKDVNFLLIGDGVLKKECQRLLKKSPVNERFVFTGWRRDVSDILDILDIFVLSSKWEGLPICVIEALYKGCPVVATDIGGTNELVRNGYTGYLTKPGVYDDMSEKILNLLKDKESFIRMQREAHLSIDSSYDLVNMVNNIDMLYTELIRN